MLIANFSKLQDTRDLTKLSQQKNQMFGLGIFEIVVLLLIAFLLIGVPATIIAIVILVNRTNNRRSDKNN